jgi:alcohol dehydrogenase
MLCMSPAQLSHGDTRCGRFEPALKLLRAGTVNVDDMISAEYPLGDAPAAFARAAEKGSVKVLLRGPA